MRSPSHLYRRNGIFYFRWVLPPACHMRLAPCPADVRLSLGTHQRSLALQRAAAMWLHSLTLAERILAGRAPFGYNEFLQMLRGPLQVIDVEDVDAESTSERRTLVSLLGTSSLKELQEAVGLFYDAGVPLTIPIRCSADVYLQGIEDDQQISSRLHERVSNFTADVCLGSVHVAEILSGQSYGFHIDQFYWSPGKAHCVMFAGSQLIVPDEPVQCMLLDVATTEATAAAKVLKKVSGSAPFAQATNQNVLAKQPLFQTTLSAGLEEWLLANSDWVRSTREAASSAVGHLIQMVGDKNPATVTPRELTDFVTLQLSLPCDYFSKPKKYKGKTAEQVAAETKRSGAKAFSKKTVANKAEWVNRFFSYLEDKAYVSKNVAGGLAPDTGSLDSKEARDPFSDEDIRKIFGPQGVDLIAKYIGRERKHIAIWGPLIGLFTGARAQEIALLTVENILVLPSGTYAIAITDQNSNESGAARLKTRASKRVVPVHPVLNDLGFMSFVNKRKTHGSNALLFPEVESYAAVHKRHTAMTKWFNDVLLKKTGVKTEKKSFHSLRHTVVQKFFADSSLAYKAHRFTGHELLLPQGTKRSTQVNTYGTYFEPEELSELLPLLDYGVDWSSAKRLIKSLGYSPT